MIEYKKSDVGVFISREDDSEMYKETYEEAQRIIRISEEVRISLEKVSPDSKQRDPQAENNTKLSTSKVAKKIGLKTQDFLEKLTEQGLLEILDESHVLTTKGKESGGETITSKRFGKYFIWPEDIQL